MSEVPMYLQPFYYHTVDAETAKKVEGLRQKYLELATLVDQEIPEALGIHLVKSLALQSLGESMMRANQALALHYGTPVLINEA